MIRPLLSKALRNNLSRWRIADLSMKSDYKVEILGGDEKQLLIKITFDDGDIYEGWVDKQ